jgi:peptidoglycan hydrolase-like protein with peptidoglycan-binding domain
VNGLLRKLRTASVVGVLSLTLLGTGYWAGSNAVVPPTLAVRSPTTLTYRIDNGTVASSTRVTVSASWIAAQTITIGRSGVVTSVVHRAGDVAKVGDVVATVDLEPVVVANGSVPAFRALGEGASGPDVQQLQQMLTKLGLYQGTTGGEFDAATIAATKRWQHSLGVKETGRVPMGALVFVDGLPARLQVRPAVGDHILPDTASLIVYEDAPRFSSMLGPSERDGVALGAKVSIDGPGGAEWAGSVDSVTPTNDGHFEVAIGGSPCGATCDVLPVDETASLNGTVELVPPVAGPVVPTSALTLEPSGKLAIRLADGGVRVVEVVAKADGFAVVSGVSAGTVILLPAPDQ